MSKKRDITFIGIYLIEQIALILLFSFCPEGLTLWISIFPIILLSTLAIEKTLINIEHKGEIDKLLNENKVERGLNEEFIKFKKNKKHG